MLESSLLERNAKIFMNPFPIISHDDGADSSSPAVSGWLDGAQQSRSETADDYFKSSE